MKAIDSISLGLLFAGGYVNPALARELAEQVVAIAPNEPARRPPATCACDALPIACCA